jgi:acetyl esterase/lipase
MAARLAARSAALLGAGFYERLAAQGSAMAAIDYRLSGEARFPAPLDDVRTAIGWVREHAPGYGIDARRVYSWGESAGGHLALLAALHPGPGVAGSGMQGVVARFPVTDLAGLPSDVADAGGVPAGGYAGGRCTLTTAERPPRTTARASLSTWGSSPGSDTVTP